MNQVIHDDDVRESPFPFNYEDFEKWYGETRTRILEPALPTLKRLLNNHLDEQLSDFDRMRIRVTTSRIKGPLRTWRKLESSKYRDQVGGLDSILDLIKDLVGVRIICNNTEDILVVQNVISQLPEADDSDKSFRGEGEIGFAFVPGSEKHYYQDPKDSGYRAYHVNLMTKVPQHDGLTDFCGELQVRTLLQDAWGELTHEDTYKPSVSMPPLAHRISRRISDLLATVDDLAQDLRDELMEQERKAVALPPGEGGSAAGEAASSKSAVVTESANESPVVSESTGQALLAETRAIVRRLTKPAPLASVAAQVQAEFGSGIVDGWGGYGNFKTLLLEAMGPGDRIEGRTPGYVVPAGSTWSAIEHGTQQDREECDTSVPELVRELHRLDTQVPCRDSEQICRMVDLMEWVLDHRRWDKMGFGPPPYGIAELNKLCKKARDRSEKDGRQKVGRGPLTYFMKSLLFSGNMRRDLSRSDIVEILSAYLAARAASYGLVSDTPEAQQSLKDWMSCDSDSE